MGSASGRRCAQCFTTAEDGARRPSDMSSEHSSRTSTLRSASTRAQSAPAPQRARRSVPTLAPAPLYPNTISVPGMDTRAARLTAPSRDARAASGAPRAHPELQRTNPLFEPDTRSWEGGEHTSHDGGAGAHSTHGPATRSSTVEAMDMDGVPGRVRTPAANAVDMEGVPGRVRTPDANGDSITEAPEAPAV